MPATREGKAVLTFGTLVIYTSELIEFKFQQKMNVSENPTIQNTTLSQPGALSLFEIQVSAKITATAETVLNTLHTVFGSRLTQNLGGLGMSYGSCYMTGLEYTISVLDEAQRMLHLELDITFTQANETYSSALLTVLTSSDEPMKTDVEEVTITL